MRSDDPPQKVRALPHHVPRDLKLSASLANAPLTQLLSGLTVETDKPLSVSSIGQSSALSALIAFVCMRCSRTVWTRSAATCPSLPAHDDQMPLLLPALGHPPPLPATCLLLYFWKVRTTTMVKPCIPRRISTVLLSFSAVGTPSKPDETNLFCLPPSAESNQSLLKPLVCFLILLLVLHREELEELVRAL